MSSAEMRICPHCDEEIRAAAKKCRHCGEYLDDELERPRRKKETHGTVERMLVPVGRPISAIAAGYCALFGIVPGFGLPFSLAALICGIFALRAIKKNPDLSGSGRAWFGIIVGGLMTLLSIFALIAMIAAVSTQPNRRF